MEFRNAFLKLMAVSAGLVVGVGILAITGYWVLHRPKTWNTNEVTATFKKLAIYENHEKPTEPHYYVNVFFDVTNNTDSDYVLPIDAWQHHLMELQSGVLLGSTGWEFSLSQATMPYKVPSDFFDPKPISIPAHATVEVRIVQDTAYAVDAVKGKTKEEVIENEFRKTDELVIFDEAMHYRINFPIKGIWRKHSSFKTALWREVPPMPCFQAAPVRVPRVRKAE